jgi:hypothetical protein
MFVGTLIIGFGSVKVRTHNSLTGVWLWSHTFFYLYAYCCSVAKKIIVLYTDVSSVNIVIWQERKLSEYRLLDCNIMSSYRWIPTFWRNMLPPSSGSNWIKVRFQWVVVSIPVKTTVQLQSLNMFNPLPLDGHKACSSLFYILILPTWNLFWFDLEDWGSVLL